MKSLMKNSDNQEFAILNGIKFFSTGQVMVFHRILLDSRTPTLNPEFFDGVRKTVWFF